MQVFRESTLTRLVIVASAAFGLAACDQAAGDPGKQVGANPVLPAPQEYLLPPMNIAGHSAWGDETPRVPAGLQVKALASHLKNPRSLYVLPNGDILVVETRGPKPPINRPKDVVMGIVMHFADSGAPGLSPSICQTTEQEKNSFFAPAAMVHGARLRELPRGTSPVVSTRPDLLCLAAACYGGPGGEARLHRPAEPRPFET